jgi:hypothetical protein
MISAEHFAIIAIAGATMLGVLVASRALGRIEAYLDAIEAKLDHALSSDFEETQ